MKIGILAAAFIATIQAVTFAETGSEGHWVNQGFVTTEKFSEADFKITLICDRLSQRFFQHTFYFKQDWQFETEGESVFRGGIAGMTIGCGPNGSRSSTFSARSRDDGISIDFRVKQTFRSPDSPSIEARQILHIPWKSFPYSHSEGDFTYNATFEWNIND